MSAKKKSPAESGTWNSLITIQLCREEYEALQKIATRLRHRKTINVCKPAAYALKTALLHWDNLEPFIYAFEDYAKAEGLFRPGIMETFQAKTIARKFKLRGTIHSKREAAL